MIALGFRANPSTISWAAVRGSKKQPILIDAAVITSPATYNEASALKWFREKIEELIRGFAPDIAAVRYPETFTIRKPNIKELGERCRIEGIILETIHSSGLPALTGALATISKNLGSASAKQYLDTPDLRGLDWSKYRSKTNVKEAILVAASALPD